METTEKRQAKRIDSINLSYILVNDHDAVIQQGMGRTLDLSSQGMLLETTFPIDPEYTVLLSLGLADDIVEVRGKVARQSRLENGNFGTGIRFIETPDTLVAVIKKFLQV